MIGAQFTYKQGELHDRESNPSNRWMIMKIILGHRNTQGDVVIPSSISSVYRDKELYFLVYSYDRPSEYEFFPVESFKPNLPERTKIFTFVADSRGNPIPPPSPSTPILHQRWSCTLYARCKRFVSNCRPYTHSTGCPSDLSACQCRIYHGQFCIE